MCCCQEVPVLIVSSAVVKYVVSIVRGWGDWDGVSAEAFWFVGDVHASVVGRVVAMHRSDLHQEKGKSLNLSYYYLNCLKMVNKTHSDTRD